MALKLEDIIEARKKIEAERKRLDEQDRALAIVEQMLGGQPSESQGVAAPVAASTSLASGADDDAGGVIKLDQLPVAAQVERRTLLDDVWEVVSRFGDQEFTVPHVEVVLNQRGRVVNGKSPRARIAMVLGTLEERGLVVRTFKGGGNVPNKFKLAQYATPQNEENPSGANTGVLDLV